MPMVYLYLIRAKSPAQLELTNAESELGFYFSTNKPLKQNNQ